MRVRRVEYKGWRSWFYERRRFVSIFFACVLLAVGIFVYGLNLALYSLKESEIVQHSSLTHTHGTHTSFAMDHTTIRVVAPQSDETLRLFLQTHTRCSTVKEIQVLWHSAKHSPPSSMTGVDGWHKVRFDRQRHDVGGILAEWAPSIVSFALEAPTASILLLDPELSLDCETIKLAQRTWAASSSSLGIPMSLLINVMFAPFLFFPLSCCGTNNRFCLSFILFAYDYLIP